MNFLLQTSLFVSFFFYLILFRCIIQLLFQSFSRILMHINYDQLISAIYQKCQEAIASGEDWQFMKNKVIFSVFESELKTAFDATVLDFGGHNESGSSVIPLSELSTGDYSSGKRMFDSIKERTTWALKSFVRDVYKGITQGVPYEELKRSVLSRPSYFYTMPMLVQGSPGTYCFVCGMSVGYYMKDGVVSAGCKIKAGTPEWNLLDDDYQILLRGEDVAYGVTCAYPNGLGNFEQYITIKSNHLVFANDLRHVIHIDPLESMDYVANRSAYHNTLNSELGGMHDQEFALNKGLIKVQVGNSSPVVAYNASNGAILVASPNAWKSKKRYTFPFDVAGFKSKGSICTDVWTVQAVDSIVFESYAQENEITLEKAAAEHGFLVPVKPGKYKIVTYNTQNTTARPVFFSMEPVD